MNWLIVRRLRLGPHHTPTGHTRHYLGPQRLPDPRELRIARGTDREGTSYFLLYLDEDGEEMTDTWHEGLDSALEQARLEFLVDPAEWETVQEPYRT